jgi:hypothetical protein
VGGAIRALAEATPLLWRWLCRPTLSRCRSRLPLQVILKEPYELKLTTVIRLVANFGFYRAGRINSMLRWQRDLLGSNGINLPLPSSATNL